MTEFSLPTGTGYVTVMSESGRITALAPGPDGPNLLWAGEVNGVAGGDRLWPAPETTYFYDDPRDRASWRCRSEIDPGSWQLDSENPVQVQQTVVGMRFARRIRALAALRVPTSLLWAAYLVDDEVSTEAWASAWHLVMVPTPASVIVLPWRRPVSFLEPLPRMDAAWIRAPTEGGRWKLGFPPSDEGSVFLAALGDPDPGGLVVVESEAPASGTYVDRPFGGGPAAAVQVFGAGLEGFLELEHHAPLETRRASASVIGAWGSRQSRLELIEALAPR